MFACMHLLTFRPSAAIKAEGYLEKVRFYSRFILNADETQLLDNY